MGAGLPPASAPTAGPGPCRAPQDPARSRVVAPQAGPSAPHAPPTGAGETRFLGHRRAPLPCPHGWGGRGALWGLPHKQTEPFPGAAVASQGPHRQRPTGTCGVDVRSGQGTRSARSTERRVRRAREGVAGRPSPVGRRLAPAGVRERTQTRRPPRGPGAAAESPRTTGRHSHSKNVFITLYELTKSHYYKLILKAQRSSCGAFRSW